MTQQRKGRKVYSAEQKLSIVKEHLIGKKPVSELCETYRIAPSLYYKWQQALFDNGAQCLERKGVANGQSTSNEVKRLQAKLEKTKSRLDSKHEVLSELMSEYVALKKSLGD